MPQLDPNTFIYQYLGVIILFILAYTLLSYIILPTLLRAILFRNLFLAENTVTANLLSVAASDYRYMFLSNKADQIPGLFNNFFASKFQLLNKLFVWNNLNIGSVSVSADTSSVMLVGLFTNQFILYLNFFLLVDDTNNE
jgi:hypothetical protein